MISPKTQKQPSPKTAVEPKNSDEKVTMMPRPVPSQDLIRERAFELYENRGREAGQDEQDWLSAEQQILKARQ
jgi:Protein of unknown function (DUF2934)